MHLKYAYEVWSLYVFRTIRKEQMRAMKLITKKYIKICMKNDQHSLINLYLI